MKTTWCIYIDESGGSREVPEFIYVAICVPFNSQQQFLKDYPEIVKPLPHSDKEIKYSPLLNKLDKYYREGTGRICKSLLTRFFDIEGAQIIRVKAIRKLMRAEGEELRRALFNKTLVLCNDALPSDRSAMILHDELPDGRDKQPGLLDTFNKFNSDKDSFTDTEAPSFYLGFQNCVFVHSNENPFIQFADFVASICYRYYYFQQKKMDISSIVRH